MYYIKSICILQCYQTRFLNACNRNGTVIYIPKYVQTSALYIDVNKAKTVSEKMHLLFNILKFLFADLRRAKKRKDFFIPSF